MIEENVWSNPQIAQFTSEDEDPGLAITLFDLVKAFGELVERAKNRPVYEVSEEEISVGQMILRLKSLFLEAGADEPVYIMRVFAEQRSRRAMITMFLAVLELVRQQAVMVAQADLFGEIVLRRHRMFDAVFAADEPAMAIEREYR
jgi:segregation and condensation protein A